MAGIQIRVVDDDVSMRDAMLVVVVIDGGNLERADAAVLSELALAPKRDELAQRGKVDAVFGIGTDHEMLVSDGRLSSVRFIVAVKRARAIHGRSPILAQTLRRNSQEVFRNRAAVVLQIIFGVAVAFVSLVSVIVSDFQIVLALAQRRVTGNRLEHHHQRSLPLKVIARAAMLSRTT